MIGKLPQPKSGFVIPYLKYTGPYNPLHEQLDEYDKPLAGQEPYNAVDAISMRHDICYRDNETKEGKHACDDEMLKDLDVLEPKGIQETVMIIDAFSKYGWAIPLKILRYSIGPQKILNRSSNYYSAFAQEDFNRSSKYPLKVLMYSKIYKGPHTSHLFILAH